SPRGRQRRAAEVLRGRQPGNPGDSPPELEELPSLEAPERCRAETLEGLRRRGLRLLRKGAAGYAGERGPVEALRRRDGRRAGTGSRKVLGEGVLSTGGQGRRRPDGEESRGRAPRRPQDAPVDERGHAAESDREARRVPPQDRLSRRLARLFGPDDRPRSLRPQRPARRRIRVPPP